MNEEESKKTAEESEKALPKQAQFSPPPKPLDKSEKSFINNSAYSQVVVYDNEKESYILRNDENLNSSMRKHNTDITSSDVRSYSAMQALYKKNSIRWKILVFSGIVLMLITVSGLLFRAFSTLEEASVVSVQANKTPGIFGYSGTAVYTYSINNVSYTGKYRFHEKETEYIPAEGDKLTVSSFNLMPSWSLEERVCIPGILHGIVFIVACFIIYDGIVTIVENMTIRKYFHKNNILWN